MTHRPSPAKWLRISYAVCLIGLMAWTFFYVYGVPVWLDGPWEATRAVLAGKPVPSADPTGAKTYPSSTPLVQRSRVGSVVMDDDGVSRYGARGLGLGLWQCHRVNEVLREDAREQTEAFVRRAMLNRKASDEAAGIVAYDIPALPDRGLSHWLELEAKLTPIIGARRANILVNCFGTALATYGRDDAWLTITTTGSKNVISIRSTDPITGRGTSTYNVIPGMRYGTGGLRFDIASGKLRLAGGGTSSP